MKKLKEENKKISGKIFQNKVKGSEILFRKKKMEYKWSDRKRNFSVLYD
jgi:hypothetical protein